jgi:O-6-methylguanine DNA methyltransferase
VLRATSRIPHGSLRSYADIARAIGAPRATRAVGQALGRNPVPIVIPCHRVTAKDGGPGGFTAGLRRKRALLALEGVRLPS